MAEEKAGKKLSTPRTFIARVRLAPAICVFPVSRSSLTTTSIIHLAGLSAPLRTYLPPPHRECFSPDCAGRDALLRPVWFQS